MMGESSACDFALVGHPADYEHFATFVQGTDGAAIAERVRKHEATFLRLVDWMPSYMTRHRPVIHSRAGDIRGRLIVCPFLPAQIAGPSRMKSAYEKVVQGCRIAADAGARVVALGGFTSMVAGAHARGLAEELGLTITSGNSLTAALAVAQLREAAALCGRSVDSEPVAILGGSGDIGRTCAHLLGGSVSRLVLAARNPVRLESIRRALPGVKAEIATVSEAVTRARLIITATSASTPLFPVSSLQPGSIVCDVGYPKTISSGPADHRTLVFPGGIAKMPNRHGLDSYTNLPGPELLFGCFAEAIVLAASPADMRHAALQGEAEEKRALAILAAAKRLGILPAPIYSEGRLFHGMESNLSI